MERTLLRPAREFEIRNTSPTSSIFGVDIRLESRVSACHYDEAAGRWTVTRENGDQASSRCLITAVGVLSVPVMPTIEGVNDFQGESFHTWQMADDPVDFRGKRIGIIGRRHWRPSHHRNCEDSRPYDGVPAHAELPRALHNGEITPEEQAEIKTSYDEIFAKRKPPTALMHNPGARRRSRYRWKSAKPFTRNSMASAVQYLMGYRDIMVDEDANVTISEFIKKKIHERVKDLAVAEKLIPSTTGSARRLPLESGYYEVYNQDNVELVDVREAPIERVTATGIKTSE